MLSRSRDSSARPDSARSSVVSRTVVTLPRCRPAGSVGRWLTASSRSPTGSTSSVATRPEDSSSVVAGSRPWSRTCRPSASSGRLNRRCASSLASSRVPSPSRIITPSRTACSTASWCSYIRVISCGPRPWVWCSRRLLIRAAPTVARASAASAAPSTSGSCASVAPPTFSSVMPADTRPTTVPSGSSTGTTACTSRPMVPSISSTTGSPARAGSMVPTNCLPMRSGRGCV